MKIIALSDIHGNLIKIEEECDVVVIAGDWSPLYSQHDYIAIMDWISKKFIPWMMCLKADHVIFISGNHDIACSYSYFEDDLENLLYRFNAKKKIHYLNRKSIIIDGKKFFGIPDTEGLTGWAFSKLYNVDYSFDEDTDILITHQPPQIGDIGYVSLYKKDFGSISLRDKIHESNIKLNICGHIHTGLHGEHTTAVKNGNLASVYNTSILDEDYIVAYSPTVIEI